MSGIMTMEINNAVRERQLQERFANMNNGVISLSEVLNESAENLDINDLTKIMFNLQNIKKDSKEFGAEYRIVSEKGKFSGDYVNFIKNSELVMTKIKRLINIKYRDNPMGYFGN